MPDQREKALGSDDQNKNKPDCISPKGSPNQNIGFETKKNCAYCGTSKTPLWRGGPVGPKSLCNACGIRSRKKWRAALGLNKKEDKKSKKGNSNKKKSSNSRISTDLGDDLMQRRKLGEEEQVAFDGSLLWLCSCFVCFFLGTVLVRFMFNVRIRGSFS